MMKMLREQIYLDQHHIKKLEVIRDGLGLSSKGAAFRALLDAIHIDQLKAAKSSELRQASQQNENAAKKP